MLFFYIIELTIDIRSDLESVAEGSRQQEQIIIPITKKRSLPNIIERSKKNKSVEKIHPEVITLETAAEQHEQQEQIITKTRSLNTFEAGPKSVQENPLELINLEIVAEGSKQQEQGLS